VHHVGILYDQFMMHGQRNIKFLSGPLSIQTVFSLSFVELPPFTQYI